jgi:hypothetical protein
MVDVLFIIPVRDNQNIVFCMVTRCLERLEVQISVGPRYFFFLF